MENKRFTAHFIYIYTYVENIFPIKAIKFSVKRFTMKHLLMGYNVIY